MKTLPEKTVRRYVYMIVVPLTVASGIGAVVSAALIQTESGVFFFKVFGGLMGFIAIYAIQTGLFKRDE